MSTKFEKILFYDENDSGFLRKLVLIIIIFYLLTTFLFFLSGIIEMNIQTILAGVILVFWLLFTVFLFIKFHNSTFLKENFRWLYLPAVFILAIIEETIIYYNGGGLGGMAKSLEHDLLLAVPVFLGIGVGIYLLHIKRTLNPGEFFILGAIQGFLIEIIFSGNIAFILILGGGAMGIYGAMMACFAPAQEDNTKTSKQLIINLLLGSVLCFIFVLIGAIIGDNLYNAIS
ncbi:MAG: hypothetical protein ACFFHV_12625 [Promethearchaeota archaeon]